MSFKVINGDGPGKDERDRERQREWVTDEFTSAIRELAANMLRVVRGAGKGYELLRQINAVLNCAIRYRDLHGYLPSSDMIAKALRFENEMEALLERGRAGTIEREAIELWWKDGTFHRMMAEDTIRRGVLQIVASGLIGQTLQQDAGQNEFSHGLERLEQIRETRRREVLKEQRANRSERSTPKKKRKLKPKKPPAVL